MTPRRLLVRAVGCEPCDERQNGDHRDHRSGDSSEYTAERNTGELSARAAEKVGKAYAGRQPSSSWSGAPPRGEAAGGARRYRLAGLGDLRLSAQLPEQLYSSLDAV